ncbi:MAG: hypothetical protein ACYSQZ_09670 [Planctomycetota bacterium]
MNSRLGYRFRKEKRMTTKTGQPGARQERAEIEKALYQNILAVDIYQKKPYTMVLVLCSHDGADIAQHMAIADIAEKIHQCQMID